MWEAANKGKNLHLIIEQDENVGYYLYVCEFGSNRAYQDYLYDDLQQALNKAKICFGVDKNEFKQK